VVEMVVRWVGGRDNAGMDLMGLAGVMKRIGIMGCGVVARRGHLPALMQCGDQLQVAAVFDPVRTNAEAAAAEFGVKRVCTDEADFWQTDMDGVSVCSPAPVHLQNVVAAAAHGKHVLCEKPLAMTDADIEAMIAATTKAGVLLATGFDYRFSPISQTIYRLVRDGTIGTVRSLRLIYVWHLHGKYAVAPDGTRTLNQRRVGRMLEGGPMVDCGVHQIDLARWWVGSEVASFIGRGAWVEDYEAPDHMWLHMDHANGAHTAVEISYTYGHTVKEPVPVFQYHIIGTDGLIRYDSQAKYFEVRTPAGTQQLPFAHEKNFVAMYQRFARAMATGELGDLPSAQDGLMATRIAREATNQAIAHRAGLIQKGA